MTDEEKAKQLYHKYGETNFTRGSAAFNAAMEMATWQKQQLIEKACEWLKECAEHYYGVEGEYSDKVDLIFCKEELLEDFKQAMMEE